MENMHIMEVNVTGATTLIATNNEEAIRQTPVFNINRQVLQATWGVLGRIQTQELREVVIHQAPPQVPVSGRFEDLTSGSSKER